MDSNSLPKSTDLSRRASYPGLIWQEIRHGARRLFRHRAFSVPAVITLALGIGAAMASFAVLESVVLRPLPYDDADRLVRLETELPGLGSDTVWNLAKGQYLHFRQETMESGVFEEMGLYTFDRVTWTPPGEPARSFDVARVSSSLFPTLGVRVLHGRLPAPDDHLVEEARVAWLLHETWERSFGGDSSIIGDTLPVAGRRVEIAGVLEPGARLPEEWLAEKPVDISLWMPLHLDPSEPAKNQHLFRAVGRLAEGVSLAKADAALDRLTANLTSSLPAAYSERFMEQTDMRTRVKTLHEDVVGDEVARGLWILFASVMVMLAVACANVTNLFLARIEENRREMAMRTALGAGRGRLVTGFLVESLGIVAVSGGLAFFLARGAMVALQRFAPESLLPRLEAIGLSAPVLAAGAALTLFLGVVFGLLPLMRRYGVRDITASGTRQTTSLGGRLLRQGLVVGQVALSLLLLVGCGLLYQSFLELVRVDPGFEADDVLTFSVVLPAERYDSHQATSTAQRRLVEELESSSAFTRAAVTSAFPMGDYDGCSALFADGRAPENSEPPCLPMYLVSPGYFDTLGMEVRGQVPDWTDASQRLPVAVVSEAAAERLWPGKNALGRGVSLSPQLEPFRVVGVAGDVRADGLDEPVSALVYLPMVPPEGPPLWPPMPIFRLGARTSGVDPSEAVAEARRAVAAFDPQVPIRDVRPLEAFVERSTAKVSFFAALLGAVSLVAFVLSAIGIYGVVSYLVTRRRTELGVRRALGAGRGEVRRMVVKEALRLALLGIVVGIGAALVATRFLESLLYGVSPWDPQVITGVAVFLLVLSALASWVPAHRAARVPPSQALREE